jgi:small subunit ribosomal protein S16
LTKREGFCIQEEELEALETGQFKRRNPMSATIRLKKFGTKKRPYYRIVVMDKHSPRDGKAIEELGYYHPIEAEDKQIHFDEERVKNWLQHGAIPSDTVHRLLNKKGLSL